MKLAGAIVIVLFGYFLFACNRNKDDGPEELIVENITFEQVVEEPEPPPPGFTSDFNSVRDWLIKLCETEHPEQSIVTYRFTLSKSEDGYLLALTGSKQRPEDSVLIDFQPSVMHYLLPKQDYESLTFQQAENKVAAEIKNFTKTDKFRKCFFGKANAITTNFSGEIWSAEKK
jgi:hypothetical protein